MAGTKEPALLARDLSKVFGEGETAVHALDGVAFEVARGEMVAIMGPSGSGKRTMLHLLGALETPTRGEICAGRRALRRPRRQRADAACGATVSGSCSSSSTCFPR